LMFDHGNPKHNVEHIINEHIKSEELKVKLNSIINERTRFIATMCSPEILEV
jgi:hypothetical protein